MVRVYLVGLVLVRDDLEDIEACEWCARQEVCRKVCTRAPVSEGPGPAPRSRTSEGHGRTAY